MSEHIKALENKNSRHELTDYLSPLKKGVVIAIVNEIGLKVYKNATKKAAMQTITEHYMYGIVYKMMANRSASY